MELSTIDWNTMWKESCGNSPWKGLSSKELWDRRAEKFNKRIDNVKSDGEKLDKDDYIYKMLARIETTQESTVLDIGCGPGTLAIPLAKKVKNITCLDISSEMLKHLKENAAKNDLANINYINCSWDDAAVGKDVEPHDIVVASRSLSPLDLKKACLNWRRLLKRRSTLHCRWYSCHSIGWSIRRSAETNANIPRISMSSIRCIKWEYRPTWKY
jgi:ubiquinone/menaquinone biosynthesis C-methylase UbiE